MDHRDPRDLGLACELGAVCNPAQNWLQEESTTAIAGLARQLSPTYSIEGCGKSSIQCAAKLPKALLYTFESILHDSLDIPGMITRSYWQTRGQ